MAWDLLKRAIGAWFVSALTFFPRLVARVLLTFGIGITTMTLLLPELVSFVQTYLNGLGAESINMLAALNVDKALTLLFSALAVRAGTRVKAIKLPSSASP